MTTAIVSKNRNVRSGRSAGIPPGLGQSPLLEGLPGYLQETLAQLGKVRSLKKGELLFMAGDPVDTMFYLFSGKLKEYFSTEGGEVCLRRIILSGTYVSLHSMFIGPSIYSYTCEAVRPTEYVAWKSRHFLELLGREPALGLRVAAVLSGYVEDSCRLQCLCRKTQAMPRVAGFLLRQAGLTRCGRPDGCHKACRREPLQANIRPLELTASNICLARETFSRALSVLQENGYIRTRGGVAEILDIEGLKRISGAG